jgi:hypothetical protein
MQGVPLIALTAIARRQPVHEIAFHLIDLVGPDLGKALVEGLRPEAGGWVSLIMPVLLKPLRERDDENFDLVTSKEFHQDCACRSRLLVREKAVFYSTL